MKNITKNIGKATLLIAVAAISNNSLAENWSSTKAELLYSESYGADTDHSMSILTIAHAGGFDWGKHFFFFDISDIGGAGDNQEIYGEWHVDASSKELLGINYGDGFIKDIYLSPEINLVSNDFNKKRIDLIGLKLGLNVPGFSFLDVSLKYRDDPDKRGNSVQFSSSWLKNFQIGQQNFEFNGFIDVFQGEGDEEFGVMTQPQLLWLPTPSLAIGTEYQYWKNKYGIDGYTEKAPQLMVSWRM
jgi:nucleoside-specific outer membrane channel protein Tsx